MERNLIGGVNSKATCFELREVVASDVDDVSALATHRSQERFVPPMGKTVLDALVPDVDENGGRLVPWFRAIVADSEIVGFVMVASVTKTLPDPILWRLLIDRMHQRRGIGFRVLDLLVETYRAAGHTQLLASWKVGTGSPEPMYLRYGFVLTGEDEEGEVVGSFDLTRFDRCHAVRNKGRADSSFAPITQFRPTPPLRA